jgi:AsmA protein
MSVLRYLVPVLAGAEGELKGRMAVDLYLRGRGESRDVLVKSLVGHGKVVLDPIELKDTPLMSEFAKRAELSSTESLASIRSDFEIQDGRIKTDHLTLTAGRVPLTISGSTGFDGRLDYLVKIDGVADRLPELARKFIGDMDIDIKSLTSIRLSGNVDRVAVTMNSGAAGRSPFEKVLRPEERARLRMLGRELRDKILR